MCILFLMVVYLLERNVKNVYKSFASKANYSVNNMKPSGVDLNCPVCIEIRERMSDDFTDFFIVCDDDCTLFKKITHYYMEEKPSDYYRHTLSEYEECDICVIRQTILNEDPN